MTALETLIELESKGLDEIKTMQEALREETEMESMVFKLTKAELIESLDCFLMESKKIMNRSD
jgi:hypothetical protein